MLILPTARSIHSHILSSNDVILDKCITIGEFEKRAILIKDKIIIEDENIRTSILKKACSFDEFSSLKIDINSLAFLKNSSYIFNFLEEMSIEGINLDTLLQADTYAEYEEHISALKRIRENYKNLLDNRGYIDKIFIPSEYELNGEYIQNIDEIIVLLEGYLSKFELDILDGSSKYTTLKIKFFANKFNTKMQDRFKDIGFDIDSGFCYILNLTTKEIEGKTKTNSNYKIECESFSQRALQTSYVKQKIYEFINVHKIEPQNIAVILPDEDFAQFLNHFDSSKNLNFAKGISVANSRFYKILDAISLSLKKHTLSNKDRLKEIDMQNIRDIKNFTKDSFKEYIASILEYEDDREYKKIIQSSLEEFLALYDSIEIESVEEAIEIFLSRISKKSKDDIGGGKITVMGVLESRGVSYDGVIALDFNDNFVPLRSNKDMFLSSKLREFASLPSVKDRENLQKYYFQRAFENSKVVAISYVKSQDSLPSKFLHDLGALDKKADDVNSTHYARLMFNDININSGFDEGIIELDYRFKKISASSLKEYLSCKRKYYHKYIKNLKAHQMPTEDISSSLIGSIIHDVLKDVFNRCGFFKDRTIFKKELRSSFENIEQVKKVYKNSIYIYHKEYWLKKLEGFIENDIKRFENGFRLFKTEDTLSIKLDGVEIYGRIDRIDIKDDKLYIIDYKTSKVENLIKSNSKKERVDYQLEMYNLLSSSLGQVDSAYYYDLNSAKLIRGENLEECTNELKSIIADINSNSSIVFDKTQNKDYCKICPYSTICYKGII